MVAILDSNNYGIFRDCLSDLIISKLAPSKQRRRVKGRKNDATPVANRETKNAAIEDLADFIEYLTQEIFSELDTELQTISYEVIHNNADLAAKYSTPLDSHVYEQIFAHVSPDVLESFSSYSVVPEDADAGRVLEPVFTAYIDAATTAPPEHDRTTRGTECELCDREHMPLTYHHLIPRQMHTKAVKRGWAKDWELQKVAWLCRACHSFVHRFASNEELARDLNTIDKLLEHEEVQSWARWVGKIRWKKS